MRQSEGYSPFYVLVLNDLEKGHAKVAPPQYHSMVPASAYELGERSLCSVGSQAWKRHGCLSSTSYVV